MKTEMLISISRTSLFGTNEEAFKHFLMASGKLNFSENEFEFCELKYSYQITTYSSEKIDVISYHFAYWVNEDANNSLDIKMYAKLQDIIESIMNQDTVHTEILWDDLSLSLAQQAYPLIYRIENLMRLLITNLC